MKTMLGMEDSICEAFIRMPRPYGGGGVEGEGGVEGGARELMIDENDARNGRFDL
jgi:hypothetical protein